MQRTILSENSLTAEEFCSLQEAVGFGNPNLKQIEKALKNSIYTVSATIGHEVVGMGRLIGDGARIYYIQDLFIRPEFQGKGIGGFYSVISHPSISYIPRHSLRS